MLTGAKARRGRGSRRRTDERLPAALRKDLDERMAKREFTSFRGLQRWLAANDCRIAADAVRRGALGLDDKIVAVRLATDHAQAAVKAIGDDEAELNHTLMRLVQEHLFNLLMELQHARLNEVELGALARSVATLAGTSIAQQKFAAELRAQILAAQRTVAEAEQRGLSAAGTEEIKRILMQVTT